MRCHDRTLAGWFLVTALVAGCGDGGLGTPVDAGSNGDGSAPVLSPPTTSDPEVRLEATCGSVRLEGGATPVLPSEPLDDEAQEAMASIGDVAPGEVGYLDGYEWFVAERGAESITLFGRSVDQTPPGQPPHAYASFDRTGDGFRPRGWGQCRIEVSAEGWGNAHWILDEEPDAGSSQLAVLINERNCASGQAPIDREIVPVVVADVDRVTITVLVEPVSGDANCPSNPWHPVTVDLPEPLGNRPLLDGSEVPAIARPWPPTQSSLDSLGYEE
jgi:hypothetical protein